jgi:hypothetical protein
MPSSRQLLKRPLLEIKAEIFGFLAISVVTDELEIDLHPNVSSFASFDFGYPTRRVRE